jgi:sugar phosphate isomerase/epimerase
MAVRSYAGWIPGGPEELRAACRLCRALGMPIFAGYSELFATDRAAAVSLLREHGIRYAYENHSDRSAAEVASHLGAGDEDVVGVAFDTGWCGTHGWDPLELLREHGSRVLAVHLKDVKARRAERTGLELVDMGHESCRLGEGIVPVRAVVAALRERGFPGPIALEHEPELFDPGEDLRAGLRTFLGWWKEA